MLNNDRTYFYNLDGLRFFAFLCIFLYHFLWTIRMPFFDYSISPIIRDIFLGSSIGVNFFFVLSGFLITYLILEEEKYHFRFNVISFYVRRILRIWPVYFLSLLIGFTVIPLIQSSQNISSIESVKPLFFLIFLSNFNNILYGYPRIFNLGILWTIGVLIQFYLLWPLLFILFRKIRILIPIIIIVISVIFRFYNSSNLAILYYHTFSVMSDFAVGSICALFIFRSNFIQHILHYLSTSQILLIYLIGILLVIFNGYIFTTSFLISVERLLLSFFLAFIILEQNYAEHSFIKMGNMRLPTLLGKYTYGLYSFHTIVIAFIVSISTTLNSNSFSILIIGLEFVISLLFSIILSLISYHLFEKRFLIFSQCIEK
jgi:peptidoglycan/LPS O-acetylase OafA/YrhL